MAGKAHPCRLERFPSSQQGIYLIDQKEALPANEVNVVGISSLSLLIPKKLSCSSLSSNDE
jgi:hypothetical protein